MWVNLMDRPSGDVPHIRIDVWDTPIVDTCQDCFGYWKALFQLLTRLVTLRVPMPVAKSQPKVLL